MGRPLPGPYSLDPFQTIAAIKWGGGFSCPNYSVPFDQWRVLESSEECGTGTPVGSLGYVLTFADRADFVPPGPNGAARPVALDSPAGSFDLTAIAPSLKPGGGSAWCVTQLPTLDVDIWFAWANRSEGGIVARMTGAGEPWTSIILAGPDGILANAATCFDLAFDPLTYNWAGNVTLTQGVESRAFGVEWPPAPDCGSQFITTGAGTSYGSASIDVVRAGNRTWADLSDAVHLTLTGADSGFSIDVGDWITPLTHECANDAFPLSAATGILAQGPFFDQGAYRFFRRTVRLITPPSGSDSDTMDIRLISNQGPWGPREPLGFIQGENVIVTDDR